MPLALCRTGPLNAGLPQPSGAVPTHPYPCTEGLSKAAMGMWSPAPREVTGDRGEEQEQPCWECREMAVVWPWCSRPLGSGR